jgi:protein SCO1/2
MRKGIERGLIIVMAAALAVLGYVGVRLYQELVLQAEQAQVAIGGPFTLTDQTGATRTEKDLLGHPSVVYFGFTYCPDVCPTELVNIVGALDQLGPQAKNVRAYFITVDPERDTQKVMADFVENIGGGVIGLTGTPEQVAQAARAYRVYYQKAKPKPDGSYSVDHSGFVYIMDRQGRYAAHLGPNAPPEKIVGKLKPLL